MPFQMPASNMPANGFRAIEEENSNIESQEKSTGKIDSDRDEVNEVSDRVTTHMANPVSSGIPGNHANVPIKCRDCGKPVDFGERFCTNCSKTSK